MLRVTTLLIAFIALLTSGARAEISDALPSLNEPKHHEFHSDILGRSLHILVRLPENYSATSKQYPTVYLLDGGITFPLFASYYRYLHLGKEVPDAIIIGISYGAESVEDGNYRGTDYTAPSSEREYFGGANTFQSVFETELLPLIEEKYRSDPDKRIIFGQSIGGQFVLYTALTKPSLFWGHIASNPALHRNLSFFLGFDFLIEQTSQSKVFVSSGANDDEVFRTPALKWFDHWSAETTVKPWALKTITLADETHFSAGPTAFRNGMKWLFANIPNIEE